MSAWVERGLEYFDQYRDSEKLCFTFIQAVVRHPDATLNEVLAEGVRKAHVDFMARFPETGLMKPYPVNVDDKDPLAALREILEPGAAAALQLSRDVEEGRLPMGILATDSRHSYIEVWVVGGPGILPIYLNVDLVNDVESACAATAMDKEVVLDGSSLAILSLLPDVAEAMLAAFSRTLIPAQLRADAVRADDDISDPAIGFAGWDPEAGRMVIRKFALEQRKAERIRAHWIRQRALEIVIEDVSALSDLDNADPVVWSWLSSLQLAKTRKVALFCDDAWTRQLATSIGVPTFGSLHLLAILSATGYVPADAYAEAITTLRAHRAVMLPISQTELLELSAAENWEQGIGALQIAQSAFWARRDAAAIYDSILVKVSRDKSQALPGWVQAGAFGASRVAQHPSRTEICAAFLANSMVRYGQVDSVPLLVEAVRVVAKRVGAGDPLGPAAPRIRDQLVARLGYRQAAIALTALTAKLPDVERHALSRVFFTLGSTT